MPEDMLYRHIAAGGHSFNNTLIKCRGNILLCSFYQLRSVYLWTIAKKGEKLKVIWLYFGIIKKKRNLLRLFWVNLKANVQKKMQFVA